MSHIDHQIAAVRRRLTANLLFDRLMAALLIAAVIGTLLIVVERSFVLGIPLQPLVIALAGVALIGAMVAAGVARADRLAAAIEIDRAAGLKARIGSAIELSSRADDPFAQATLRDAEQVAAKVHVPSHVPLRLSPRWPHAVAALGVLGLAYLFMPELDLLAPADEAPLADRPALLAEREQAERVVNEVAERTRERLEGIPGLDGDLNLGELALPKDPGMTPADINREVAKRTENVAERLRQQLELQDFKAQGEFERRLSRLSQSNENDLVSRLRQALSRGDANAARETLDELRHKLDQAADQADLERQAELAELSRKLEELSQQMAELADNQADRKELENKAGMSPEQAEELLKQLEGLSAEQMEKLLSEAMKQMGNKLDAEQIQQIARKLAQNQQAREKLMEMAKCLQQAASACNNPGEGSSGALAEAMQQLSKMEMAQQMIAEIEAALGDVRDLQNNASQAQGICRGPGDRPGSGAGDGVGPGEGEPQNLESPYGFRTERARGAISAGYSIGELLVDGPIQVSGQTSAPMREALNSALRDATEAIEREDVPRQYHALLRNYFGGLAGLVGEPGQAEPKPDSEASD